MLPSEALAQRYGVVRALFRGGPADEEERAAVARWMLYVPKRHSDAAFLSGQYTAIGYAQDKPIYQNENNTDLLMLYDPQREKWVIESQDHGALAWAHAKEHADHPPKTGWYCSIIAEDAIAVGVTMNTIKEQAKDQAKDHEAPGTKEEEDSDGQDTYKQAASRKRRYNQMDAALQPCTKYTEPALPLLPKQGPDSAAHAWPRAVPPPPPPPISGRATPIGLPPRFCQSRPLFPAPPGTPPPAWLSGPIGQPPPQQREAQHQGTKRGGWFNKAQALCKTIIDKDFQRAERLADEWYCAKADGY